MTSYAVSGPYRYPHDLHESYRIDGPEGLVATVYAYDSAAAAEQRALVMADALRSGAGDG